MFARNFAADPGSGSSPATDVQTELTALQADVRGLAESVQRLVAEAPDLAKGRLEQAIRREPTRAALIAAATGFVVARLLAR